MGSALPKQYLRIGGVTVLEHSLRALLAEPRIGAVVVALRADDPWSADVPVLRDPRIHCVAGGAERSDSVLCGLRACLAQGDPADWVLVHDAARPCLDRASLAALIDRVLESACGAVLAQPVADTVKRTDADGRVLATVEREGLWLAQTPQMFRLGELHAALEAAAACGLRVTDEASAMELAGLPVQLLPGPRGNIKLTTPEDVRWAQWQLLQDVAGADLAPAASGTE
jgi:2-C-methyl-D-erythritol 4-phosphate cytidylyltransferase